MKPFIASATFLMAASALASGSQVIDGFRYASCTSKQVCVEIVAPKAWISFLHGGFSTAGATELKVHDSVRPGQIFVGVSASLNGRMQMITLEQADGGVVTYQLADGQLSVFSGGGK